ncbi:MAG: hypothetical protein ABS85_10810 [Sphingobacteriales bacterium SCN 48-20]|uniref:hypothetical protein n=1 Tax=Terrimonas ferruginea TaxID=249 RepID=UPI00086DBE5D|nr:hypothetical protein [Terrimonas ferruginea]MBN8784790.1 hypothetical protein [Terrimonas ferruginea]ODT92067.1 MAG: hypothetical protein ABS85_10810 [Sphingobacteriales bacterium SCN 48-20]OJW45373.1 MAG: hypothetical protein BGO56_02305 [Sphingobacteriales bacterium 48-107]
MTNSAPRKLLQTLTAAFALLLTIGFSACSNKDEDFTAPAMSEYLPLEPGRYIVYRLDSTVFTNLNRDVEIHSYQVKHVVDAQINDNLGRPSYRVYRYIRDKNGTQPWTPSGSFMVTSLSDQTEITDDNQRVIKLHVPLREGFSWKGNRYLPTNPYGGYYSFSVDDDMKNWDFYYDTFQDFSYDNRTYTDVLSVEQINESHNLPIQPNYSIASKERSVERYSRDIGLVYKEYHLWEYQNNSSSANPTYTGFGVTMWMIDHN